MTHLFKTPHQYLDGDNFVDSGGSVPAELPTTEIIPDRSTPADTDAGKNALDNFIDENPEGAKRFGLEPKADEPAAPADDGEVPKNDEFVDFSDDRNFLDELGPEFADYENVQDALMSLSGKNKEFSTSHEKNQGVIDQINNISKALGTTPDELVASLGALDPNKVAQQSPEWTGVDSFIKKFDVAEADVPFYRNMANSMAGDIGRQMEAQNARAFNSLYGEIQEIKFESQMNKFLQNPDNADFNGRNKEIWNTLQNDMPHMIGKSNAVDVATRYLRASKAPVSTKQKVADATKKRYQDIQANKRRLSGEGPARGPDVGGGVAPTDPQKMNAKQLASEINRRENRGETIGKRHK